MPCPKCDAAVEVFQDEASCRCRSCGHRFRNPKMAFDCAQWCAYAEECVGFVPERRLLSNPGEGALASRLIQQVKQVFQTDQARLAHALTVFQHARELLLRQGGDPRIILAAALLLGLATDRPEPGSPSAGQPTGQTKGSARPREILQGAGLDEETAECVCRILEAYQTGREIDTIEFRVVREADTLAKRAAADPRKHSP